jgi:hypothetical protein
MRRSSRLNFKMPWNHDWYDRLSSQLLLFDAGASGWGADGGSREESSHIPSS